MIELNRLQDALKRGEHVRPEIENYQAKDASRRELQAQLDQRRAEHKLASEKMAKIADKKSADFAAARDELKHKSAEIKDGEQRLAQLEAEALDRLLEIPNGPWTDVPVGVDESGNQEVARWGTKPTFTFKPRDHVELGLMTGIMDFERAAKLSGARFVVLKGKGPRLVRALITFMLESHIARGYEEVWVPSLVKRPAMIGTGQLPKFEDDAFRTHAKDGEEAYYLVPTAEVPVTNLHREEILEAAELPKKYTAYTPCFRAEAGSHGKDTRGMIRQHQFDKVEVVRFVTPDAGLAALEELRDDAEEILRKLGLHFRTSLLCSGDMGFASQKTYDLEVWLPGQDTFREISSCSWFGAFQARRAQIRFRPAPGEKPQPVHTLNGSGLAVGRTLVALLEQGQQADGSVVIPKALVPYCGFERLDVVRSSG